MPDINYTMDKLTGLAALFGPEGMTDSKSLSVEASNGICLILEDCARDLDQIGRQYETSSVWKSDREKRLERFMSDMADQMDEADEWSLTAAAANIRHVLSR